MSSSVCLVFGDLHGRILPAFRLAAAWSREHGVIVDALLQVGDLGFFPYLHRLDSATRRQADDDPLELGALLVAEPSPEADQVFRDENVADALWFTAGNHEDHEALQAIAHGNAFAVDAYSRVWCIRDGQVAALSCGLRVGALWGIDGQAPNRRRHTSRASVISPRSATRLRCSAMDVLLTHDSPMDAIVPGSGSQDISDIIAAAQPAFAFFGHYRGPGSRIEMDFGKTQVFHLNGMELRKHGHHAEEGSVGVLTWQRGAGVFEYVDPAWLRTFSRHGWLER